MEVLSGMSGKHCGNMRKCLKTAFFIHFPLCFQKPTFPRFLKLWIVWLLYQGMCCCYTTDCGLNLYSTDCVVATKQIAWLLHYGLCGFYTTDCVVATLQIVWFLHYRLCGCYTMDCVVATQLCGYIFPTIIY